MLSEDSARRHYRAIFLSDIHLGSPDSKSEALLDFLRDTSSDKLYLVGDILDFWSLKRVWHWRQSHNDVIQKVLRKSRKGTKVIYIPGNHDDAVREFGPLAFGDIEILPRTEHVLLDGRKLLVMHGDEFDSVLGYPKLFHPISGVSYRAVRCLARAINATQRIFGRRQWSLAGMIANVEEATIKTQTKFKELVSEEARTHLYQGVVCGHVHWPFLEEKEGFIYANTGDWVDHCTALVETLDGKLELLVPEKL